MAVGKFQNGRLPGCRNLSRRQVSAAFLGRQVTQRNDAHQVAPGVVRQPAAGGLRPAMTTRLWPVSHRARQGGLVVTRRKRVGQI
jgi:hypothetical protein